VPVTAPTTLNKQIILTCAERAGNGLFECNYGASFKREHKPAYTKLR
jgi:hypothetical protein